MNNQNFVRKKWIACILITSCILIVLIMVAAIIKNSLPIQAHRAGSYTLHTSEGDKQINYAAEGSALEIFFSEAVEVGLFLLIPLSLLNIVMGSIVYNKSPSHKTVALISIIIGVLPILIACVYLYLLMRSGFY